MKEYIIFGTGETGKKAYHFLKSECVYGFCDNNTHSVEEKLFGKPVINASRLSDFFNPNEFVLVLATTKPKFIIEISRQLDKMAIPFVLLEDIATEMVHAEGEQYERMNPPNSFKVNPDTEYIIPLERIEEAGVIGSYFWQDLWAARHICNDRPKRHFDIGSRLDGFISHLLSAAVDVTMLDIRPLSAKISGLAFIQTDATNLNSIPDNSIESLSALCSLEHFGLGRYGDPINPMSCFKCFDAIQRKLRQDGMIYISVPIGREHLEFNAHRVFAASTIVNSFYSMELIEFSSCWNEQFEENIPLNKYDEWDVYGGERFGLFRFRKK